MLPSVTNLKSICRGSASIALLIALLTVAGGAQALAPAPAAAMIDMGGECGDPVVSDPSYCDENGGGGGSAGTGGESAGGDTENWQSPEVIEVRDPVDPCRRSPASCLPKQTGGGRQARADGPRIPLRSRHGARPARVAEIPVTLDQCLKLARDWTRYGLPLGVTVLGSDAVANRVWEEYARLAAKLSDARSQMMTLKAAKHQEKSGPSKDEKTQEQGLKAQLAEQRALQVEIDSIERSLNAKRQIFEHLQEANRAAHKVLRNVCRQEYPELFRGK